MPCNILLVDDDDVAVESLLRGLNKSGATCDLTTAENGLEALEIIQGAHASKSINTPFVILLDLNMPVMNGFEFLSVIRADKTLSASVVFVLTTSGSDEDIAKVTQHNIAGYLIKGTLGKHHGKLFHLIEDYISKDIRFASH